jgi:hypothetical protein
LTFCIAEGFVAMLFSLIEASSIPIRAPKRLAKAQAAAPAASGVVGS